MDKCAVKSSIRLNKNINNDYDNMADETGKTKTDLINTALSFYSDVFYCKNKATFLNENILAAMQAMVDSMEHRLNNKTNQLLSELAIQESIIAQMLAYTIDVKGDVIAEYRKNAIENLKVNQRVLRLDELVE